MPEHPSQDRLVSASARFRGTRDAHRGETAEDYLEAVLSLQESAGCARVGDLAKHMGVSHVTVSRIIARLARDGLVSGGARKPIMLTPLGTKVARRSRRRHEIVLAFLLALKVPPAQAEIDAEGIEHHVSEATIRAIKRWVGTREDDREA
jgi:DtxR family manganese transport transcriptional regulator